MGVIENGTVSGVLPSVEGFVVHYPGYPSSTSRAIETLGGTEGILKTRSSQSNFLELRFRPEDPYSHPAFGELRPCNSLLLRISKKKCATSRDAVLSENLPKQLLTDMPKLNSVLRFPECEGNKKQTLSESGTPTISDDKDAAMHEESSPSLSADIIARVPEEYHFDGMIDYQHVLAVHADVARRRKRHWADMEPNFENDGLMDTSLMMLVPPLFSPKDIPGSLVLKPSATMSSKRRLEGIVRHHWEMDIEPCIAIDFKTEKIPRKINWEDKIPKGSIHWELQMAVSKLFDERPIWPRRSLHERLLDDGLKVSVDQLKRLLFRAGYYFSNGPFSRFWIRKGYDPRTDSESRIYQRVDFRLSNRLRDYGDDEFKYSWKDICEFRAFPSQSFTSLQLFELVDEYIQQEIRKPSEQTTCAHSTGWFSTAMLNTLMLRVRIRFLSVCPKMAAKDLLKSASELFERSKKLHDRQRYKRHDEVEHQNVNKDSNCHASEVEQLKSNDMELLHNDDKNVLDEAEVDEGEDAEELDEYGSSNLGEDDGSSPLQASSYPIGENISNNYLQDLLRSLPFTQGGKDYETNSKVQDASLSDGEYPIYEQDSGDDYNYFDDDCDDDDDDDGFS